MSHGYDDFEVFLGDRLDAQERPDRRGGFAGIDRAGVPRPAHPGRSRARGDAEIDSDVDVLVVLRDLGDSWEEAKRMSPLATRLSMDHNVLITVLPAAGDEFETSQRALFVNCRREGIRVE